MCIEKDPLFFTASDRCVECKECSTAHNNGDSCGENCNCSCRYRGGKLEVFDYLNKIPSAEQEDQYVEIQFKNTRKGYFINSLGLPLKKGEIVAVNADPGHDIGVVSLVGRLVLKQMQRRRNRHQSPLEILRIALPEDLTLYNEAKAREQETMIRSRKIAKELGLEMKIGDVEYQGDGLKAIFYYIADGRVDFRQLIRRLASEFHIRVEMKQIGARQEAGLIGGVGPCGGQLCCSGWMTSFSSVGSNAAKVQDIPINAQKQAGLCGKLKCCLNYEIDTYKEARKYLPPKEIELRTESGDYKQFKSDILGGIVYYRPTGKRTELDEIISITSHRAFEIIAMNEEGLLPFSLKEDKQNNSPKSPGISNDNDLLSQESLTRFDKQQSQSLKSKHKKQKRQKQSEDPSTKKAKDSPSHTSSTGKAVHKKGVDTPRKNMRHKHFHQQSKSNG